MDHLWDEKKDREFLGGEKEEILGPNEGVAEPGWPTLPDYLTWRKAQMERSSSFQGENTISWSDYEANAFWREFVMGNKPVDGLIRAIGQAIMKAHPCLPVGAVHPSRPEHDVCLESLECGLWRTRGPSGGSRHQFGVRIQVVDRRHYLKETLVHIPLTDRYADDTKLWRSKSIDDVVADVMMTVRDFTLRVTRGIPVARDASEYRMGLREVWASPIPYPDKQVLESVGHQLAALPRDVRFRFMRSLVQRHTEYASNNRTFVPKSILGGHYTTHISSERPLMRVHSSFYAPSDLAVTMAENSTGEGGVYAYHQDFGFVISEGCWLITPSPVLLAQLRERGFAFGEHWDDEGVVEVLSNPQEPLWRIGLQWLSESNAFGDGPPGRWSAARMLASQKKWGHLSLLLDLYADEDEVLRDFAIAHMHSALATQNGRHQLNLNPEDMEPFYRSLWLHRITAGERSEATTF